MATITPANLSYKDKDGDLGEVKSLTDTDVTLLNNALQDIEDLKLAYSPGFVKRDFSNVTQNGKDASISWGLPDWSAGVSKTNTGFTADLNGFLYALYKGTRGCTIYANGTLIFSQYMTYSEGVITAVIPISAGDVITTVNDGNVTEFQLIFYPCKGA